MKKGVAKVGVLLASMCVLAACSGGDTGDSGKSEPEVELSEAITGDGTIDWTVGLTMDEIDEVYNTRLETPHELDTEDADIRVPDDSYYVKMKSLEDIKEFHANGTGILYFSWVECPYCLGLRQDLDLVLEDLDQPIYYIERSDFTDKENKEIYGLFEVEYVPTTVVYMGGQEVDRMPEPVLGNPSYMPIFEFVANAVINIKGLLTEEDIAELESIQEEQEYSQGEQESNQEEQESSQEEQESE